MKIGMVVLSAGSGSRFGESKLESTLNNRPIIEYILSNIPVDSLSQVIVVAANQNIIDIAKKYGIWGIINSKSHLGIARSIKMGTEVIKDMDAYMYCVSDQPLLSKSTIEDMISAYEENTILALSSNNRRGNPVIFPAFLYDKLITLEKDESGKKVINNHLDILKLHQIENGNELLDIDTKDDLAIINSIINKKSF